ncbi:VOC family protein [Guyparkeria hydrothermalis]|uniref:Glyoxalase n=1 Tax=Guyparkeria halophila TaxID=47960 RepID=A0A6I6DC41_9GAMM|nr:MULTISPECIES: VOC family protein [Guyparkeria]MCL7750653.1 VOC family protein [Guyparkeria hydrothermalis]QGT79352.1 glyoxalase [Guyparkeria halophila]TKA89072.1 glyoxalase [Guyparkeria sp. SB14A]
MTDADNRSDTRPEVRGVDHVSLMVRDARQARDFYTEVLGLAALPRPDLGFPGAWLSLGGGQALHLLELPNPDPREGRPEHGGRDRHVALRVAETAPFAERLEARGMRFTRSRSGRDALFFRDLDGNAVELVGTG